MPTISPRQGQQAPEAPPAPRTTIQANTSLNRPLQLPKEPVVSQPNTTEVAETPPAQAVTLSPQASALARREQRFRQQVQEFEQRKNADEASRKDFVSISDLKNKKGSQLLQTIGLSYDELTQQVLDEQNGIDPHLQKLEAIESKVNNLETSMTESQKKQIDGVIMQYEGEIGRLVASNPEFEMIKARKAEGIVLQHILDTFNDPEDGEILTVEQAAREIEEQLLEDAMEIAKVSKVQAKLAPPVAAASEPQQKKLPPPVATQAQQKSEPVIKSISNGLVATTPRTYQQMQHLSPRERLELAMKKAQDKSNQR